MNKRTALLFISIVVVASVVASGCTSPSSSQTEASPKATVRPTVKVSTVVTANSGSGGGSNEMKTIDLTSPALTPGGRIPPEFTCTGKNDSPPLSFGTAPEGTASLAVICEDPDAPGGTFTHWILYNIPPGTTSLPQGIARKLVFPDGSAHGLNDFGKTGYDGPCPPPGTPHRYFFRLYALDTLLDLSAPVIRKNIDAAMQGHILGQGELMGTFGL